MMLLLPYKELGIKYNYDEAINGKKRTVYSNVPLC